MKKLVQTIFIIFIAASAAVIVYFYFTGKKPGKLDEPTSSRLIDVGALPVAADSVLDNSTKTKISSPIPIDPNETLLDIYAFNLDYDEEEEQILVIRENDDPESLIRIIIADYSPFTKRWTRSWKGPTLVTKAKTFQVSVSDLVGDHNLNIVCTGMNDNNEQTMAIYWKVQNLDSKFVDAFMPIFEQAGSTVLIESSERPDSYKMDQSNAESWPIFVWKEDYSSGNYLDQIREQWVWSFSAKEYVLKNTESIPGASIARKMAESILDGNEDTFKSFLNGTWYKESIDPLSGNAQFITFQPQDESILFSSEDIIEINNWESSNLTRYGLYIASNNYSVRNLRRLMDIELAGADAVNVRIFQDYRIKADISGKWDGKYRRLGAELAKAFKRPLAMAVNSKLVLSGTYVSEDGQSITFDKQSYKKTDGSMTETGIYGIFELAGQSILELRKDDKADSSTQRKTYVLKTTEKPEPDGKAGSKIELKDTIIGILGPESTQNAAKVFVKSAP